LTNADNLHARRGFWIWRENLVPLLLLLSEIVGYAADDSDLDALHFGLSGTSDEKEIWFAYSLIGRNRMDMELANDLENDDIVHVSLNFEKTLGQVVDFATYVVADFSLKHRMYAPDTLHVNMP